MIIMTQISFGAEDGGRTINKATEKKVCFRSRVRLKKHKVWR